MSEELSAVLIGPTGVRLELWTQDDGDRPRLEKLDGWFDGVDARSEKVERIGDGVFSSPVHATGRELTLGGFVRDLQPSEVVAWQRIVGGMFGDSTNESTGLLTANLSGETLTCEVQRDGRPKVTAERLQGWVRFELPLLAPSPWLYGRERQATMTPAGTGAGLKYPLVYPLSYGTDLGSPNATLTNDGNAPAWPTFTVTGDFPSGFRISMSGRVVEYPYATFWATPVTVDMRGHLMVGGVDQQAMLTRREWTSIPASGVAVARFEPIQSGGTGACVATVRDTYL